MVELWLFLGNLSAHWVFLMGGLAGVCISTLEHFRRKPWVPAFRLACVICFIVSADRAWQDEHRNTQATIAEKAALAAADNSCVQDARTSAAFTQGLQFAGLNQEQIIASQQALLGRQQNIINGEQENLHGCMAKMIPKLSNVYSVTAFPVMKSSVGNFIFGMVISTNQPAAADGTVRCDKPFVATSLPISGLIPGSRITLRPNSAQSLNDHEISIRASTVGREWSSTEPVTFVVVSNLEALKCEFIPL